MARLWRQIALVALVIALPGCWRQAESPILQANQLFGEGDWDGTIAVCDQILATDPHRDDALLLRGRSYLEGKQDYQQAIADYTAAIEIDPKNPEPFHFRAAAYRLVGDKRSALDDATVARTLDPYYKQSYLYEPGDPSRRSMTQNEFTKKMQADQNGEADKDDPASKGDRIDPLSGLPVVPDEPKDTAANRLDDPAGDDADSFSGLRARPPAGRNTPEPLSPYSSASPMAAQGNNPAEADGSGDLLQRWLAEQRRPGYRQELQALEEDWVVLRDGRRVRRSEYEAQEDAEGSPESQLGDDPLARDPLRPGLRDPDLTTPPLEPPKTTGLRSTSPPGGAIEGPLAGPRPKTTGIQSGRPAGVPADPGATRGAFDPKTARGGFYNPYAAGSAVPGLGTGVSPTPGLLNGPRSHPPGGQGPATAGGGQTPGLRPGLSNSPGSYPSAGPPLGAGGLPDARPSAGVPNSVRSPYYPGSQSGGATQGPAPPAWQYRTPFPQPNRRTTGIQSGRRP